MRISSIIYISFFAIFASVKEKGKQKNYYTYLKIQDTPFQMMTNEIQHRIHTLRGVQVILDSDLAKLYQVQTKVFNQAVTRNIDRFPDGFRFQLTWTEVEMLRLQIVTLNKENNILLPENKNETDTSSRSQIVTLKRGTNIKYLPYAFTEQGVAMLSGILKNDIAIQVSIRIISTFVEMRKFIAENLDVFLRLDTIERRQLNFQEETDRKFNQIFNALQSEDNALKQKIFFEGQIYDAYSFIIRLIEKADKEILLIDNYINNEVLNMLAKKRPGVEVILYTSPHTKITQTDLQRFNAQYPTVNLKYTHTVHDRFLLLDGNEIYHIGASLKDAGKKCFAFSLIEDNSIITDLLKRL